MIAQAVGLIFCGGLSLASITYKLLASEMMRLDFFLLFSFAAISSVTAAKAQEDILSPCRVRDVASAIASCTSLISRGLPPDIQLKALAIRGARLVEKGEFDRAIIDLDRFLQTEPDNPYVLISRAAARMRLGNIAGARDDIGRAQKVKPDLAAAFTTASTISLLEGASDRALAEASRAIELDKNQGAAHSNRGAALREMGNYEQALLSFNIAVRLLPLSSRPLVQRALLYLRRNEPSRALVDYDAALALDANDREAKEGRELAVTKLASQGGSQKPPSTELAPNPLPTGTNDQAASNLSIPSCDRLSKFPLGKNYNEGVVEMFFGKKLIHWNKEDFFAFRDAFIDCKMNDREFLRNYSQREFVNRIDGAPASEIRRLNEIRVRLVEANNISAEKTPLQNELRILREKVRTSSIKTDEIRRLEQIKSQFSQKYVDIADAATAILKDYKERQQIQIAKEQQERLIAEREKNKPTEDALSMLAVYAFIDYCSEKTNVFTRTDLSLIRGFVTKQLDELSVSKDRRDEVWIAAQVGINASGTKQMSAGDLAKECNSARTALVYTYPSLFSNSDTYKKSPF